MCDSFADRLADTLTKALDVCDALPNAIPQLFLYSLRDMLGFGNAFFEGAVAL